MFKTDADLTDKTWHDHVINSLPAVMNQDDDSNNQKLLEIIATIVLKHKNDMLTLSDTLSVEKAYGNLLEWLADDWGVSRVDSDDGFLKFQITVAKLKAQSGVSMNDLKNLVSLALGIEPSQFDIVATDNIEEMKIVNIPFNFASGDDRARKVKLFEQTFQEVLPVEWNLAEIQYSITSSVQLYAGVATQEWRQSYPILITSNLEGVDLDG